MTDAELDEVIAAARTVPADRRAEFLEHLGRRLTSSADFGEGIIQRAIATTKRDLGPRLMDTIVFMR